MVRNTGTVFEALTARDQALAGAIVGSNRTFRALASRDEALAETFQIFPTFQSETRLTLERLEKFAENAGPLFRDLKPVARDLSPTLRDVRRLSPHARRLFKNLNPLIKASRDRAARRCASFLDELRPVMVNLDPFLANLNPIIRYLDFYTASRRPTSSPTPPRAPRARCRRSPSQTEPAPPLAPDRQPASHRVALDLSAAARTNRGNGYLLPFAIGSPALADQGAVFPQLRLRQHRGVAGSPGGDGRCRMHRPGPAAVGPPRPRRRRRASTLPAAARLVGDLLAARLSLPAPAEHGAPSRPSCDRLSMHLPAWHPGRVRRPQDPAELIRRGRLPLRG